MPDWITPEDVAKYLDVPYPDSDGRVDHATSSVRAAVERRRSDLDFATSPVPDDVRNASIEWAALIYQARNSPAGFSGYDEQTAVYDSLGARRSDIMRRIGWRRPVVA